MELNLSQKKIIAAMYELIPAGYVHRREINRVIATGATYGIRLSRMLALRDGGLIEPESDEAVGLVKSKRCTCHCDRWRLTDAGRRLARTLNVVMDRRAKSEVDFAIYHNSHDKD